MKAELDLERDPAESLVNFSTIEHPTYTDEQPNSLTVEEARAFVTKMRELYPQHYAITVLGFATGLRPSSLRPLRRSGPDADIVFDESGAARLRVRRSHSLGSSTMGATKTGRWQTLHLPPELGTILREHTALVTAFAVDTGDPAVEENAKGDPLIRAMARPKSELLFPSTTGSFRSRSGLDVAFRKVAAAIGLRHRLTPRGMRRTFQDLARLAAVDAVVTRSISGHATVSMQEHYSTAKVEEQRAGIAKVYRLIDRRRTA
jgi:integrase